MESVFCNHHCNYPSLCKQVGEEGATVMRQHVKLCNKTDICRFVKYNEILYQTGGKLDCFQLESGFCNQHCTRQTQTIQVCVDSVFSVESVDKPARLTIS